MTTPTPTPKRPAVELDDDVAWYLQCSPSIMGETSGYGAFVAALERGTVRRGGVANIDIYSDRQIGWGPEERLGEIERARRLRAVWQRLSSEDQDILCLRYTTRSEWPPGVVSRFGQLAAIALYLAPDRSKVLRACECPATPHALSVIDGALRRAERANRRAHEAWRQARNERYQEWVAEQEQLEAMRWRAA